MPSLELPPTLLKARPVDQQLCLKAVAVLLWRVGSVNESWQSSSKKWNATDSGWLVPNEIRGMMICKVAYHFSRLYVIKIDA
jgi:hypothetical protein